MGDSVSVPRKGAALSKQNAESAPIEFRKVEGNVQISTMPLSLDKAVEVTPDGCRLVANSKELALLKEGNYEVWKTRYTGSCRKLLVVDADGPSCYFGLAVYVPDSDEAGVPQELPQKQQSERQELLNRRLKEFEEKKKAQLLEMRMQRVPPVQQEYLSEQHLEKFKQRGLALINKSKGPDNNNALRDAMLTELKHLKECMLRHEDEAPSAQTDTEALAAAKKKILANDMQNLMGCIDAFDAALDDDIGGSGAAEVTKGAAQSEDSENS
jgi:hypothetical protein